MRTLVLAPELHRSSGGIPRILQLYVRALEELDPEGRVDVVVLNDRPEDGASLPRARGEGQRGADSEGKGPTASPSSLAALRHMACCSRSKWRFVWHAFRLGWSADRIVCGHLHLLPVAGVLARLRPSLKVHLVAHGIEVWREPSPGQRRALRRADRILCVSDFTRRELLRHVPELAPDRLVVVPNAVDPGFLEAAQSAEGRGQREVPPVAPRLLTVARLTSVDREKGVEDLICAMPAIRQRHPRAHLRIVGGGDDAARLAQVAEGLGLGAARKSDEARQREDGERSEGECLTEAGTLGVTREQTRDLKPESGSNPQLSSETLLPQVSGLKSQVFPAAVSFTGTVNDEQLLAEYAACDLFALPSRKEGFGLVYLEAMAFGKPCLAANAGGAPEVVGAHAPPRAKREGQSVVEAEVQIPAASLLALGSLRTPFGVLVPYGDREAIAAAVDDLVAHPRDPVAIRARAQSFSYANFKVRLQAALGEF